MYVRYVQNKCRRMNINAGTVKKNIIDIVQNNKQNMTGGVQIVERKFEKNDKKM